MDWRAQCAAVIPCLNEAARIGPLVERLRLCLPNVIVVDDGSRDATAIVAREAGAEVLEHPSSQGKGAALQTGWKHALQRGFSWALSLDGDGQHSPEDIPAFFHCMENTGADLVVGDRFGEANRIPWVRRQVNRWMSRRLSRAMGHRLPDTQCGFRLMRLSAWHSLPLAASHYEIESEILVSFVHAGFKVDFVPIRVIYAGEHSKIHPVWDTVRWFGWLKSAKTRGLFDR